MGTGWRKAFCTSIKRNPESPTTDTDNKRSSSNKQSPSPNNSTPSTPRGFIRFGFRSSTPPTHKTTPITDLRCRTTPAASEPSSLHNSPRLHCKTTPAFSVSTIKSTPRIFSSSSTPSSPKSPSRFSLFKSSLRLTKNSCGVCLQSMKSGEGTAIFAAECSHSFHFPCIASHVKKHGSLVCPVCSTNWREVPLLALHKNQKKQPEEVITKTIDNNKKQSQPQKPSIYDDDEPLSSPTGCAAGRFNTIPEVDEEEENEDEFQGFFVDPNIPASFISDEQQRLHDEPGGSPNKISAQIIRHVEVKLLPVSAVISVRRRHETIAVAIKIKAPPPPARTSSTSLLDPTTRRAPIDLVTVLDVSGSMTGEKLLMLKRAMRLVISSLGSCDRLSIIAFSSLPIRLLPLRRMTPQGQKCARRIIDRLVVGKGSSVGDALRKATKVLEDRREKNPVASIMLLSDGHVEEQENHNQKQQSQHRSSKTRFSHLEIPVAENQEPTEDAFAKCVGGLLSVVVHDLRLQLGFYHGSAPAEIAAVYSCTGKPTLLGSNSVRLGDLYAEEERELLVELKVPILKHHQQQPSQYIMSVRSCYKDPATQEVIFGKDQPLLVPRTSSVKSSAVSKIERLRNLFITTRAVAEATRLIQHNDLSNAFHLLSSTKSLLKQSNSDDSEYLVSLENELSELSLRRQNLLLPQQRFQYQQQQIRRCVVNEREPVFSVDDNAEPLTPTSAWRAAEKLAKVAIMRKSMNRVSDLHGFENAGF